MREMQVKSSQIPIISMRSARDARLPGRIEPDPTANHFIRQNEPKNPGTVDKATRVQTDLPLGTTLCPPSSDLAQISGSVSPQSRP